MKPIKQTVYLPVKENGKYILRLSSETDKTKSSFKRLIDEQEGYFFTSEQLNKYTHNVGKAFLETAAQKVTLNTPTNYWQDRWVDKQSITNTFEETFKKFEV